MWQSIIRITGTSLLSLIGISILIFFLSKAVPGDAVQDQVEINFESSFEQDYLAEYSRIAKERRLDYPLFYFHISPSNFPANLNSEISRHRKQWIKRFLFQGYVYNDIVSVRNEIDDLISNAIVLKDASLANRLNTIHESSSTVEITHNLSLLIGELGDNPEVTLQLKDLIVDIEGLNKSRAAILLPKFHWSGLENQYHFWISSYFRGDFGKSNFDSKPVLQKIQRSFIWTIFLVLISLTLSYLIGILLGIFLSTLKSQVIKNWLERILFGFYAIPLFWLATLLLVFFTTPEYGRWTNIFPSVGLVPIDTGEAWFIRIWTFGKQLILPCFCLIIHNLAFLSSLTKRNIERYKKSGFVLTSKAYGFSEKEILYSEVLPHSLLPLITSISASIPAALGGSLIIEIIFNIPGMGRLLFNGILNYDWAVVFAVVLLIAILTIISYLLAEIAYRKADPRIKSNVG